MSEIFRWGTCERRREEGAGEKGDGGKLLQKIGL
jgi:hypothetical protein